MQFMPVRMYKSSQRAFSSSSFGNAIQARFKENSILKHSLNDAKPEILSNDRLQTPGTSASSKPKKKLGIIEMYKLEKAKAEAEERIELAGIKSGKAKTKRAALFEEAFSQGYFHDAKELVKLGLKPAKIQTHLYDEISSYPFPNLDRLASLKKSQATTSLIKHIRDPSNSDLASLVLFFSSQLGEKQTRPWIDWYEKSARNSKLNIIQLNVEENKAKSIVQFLFLYFLRRRTAPHLQSKYFRYPHSLPRSFRSECHMSNKYLGYAYLLDNQARIRWQCTGEPTVEEFSIFSKIYKDLLASQHALNI